MTNPHLSGTVNRKKVKCTLLKCNMNGYAQIALFDTGAQVSLIDRPWKQKYSLYLTNKSTL